MSDNPATQTARERKDTNEMTLSTGIRAKLHPVSAALISEVTRKIKNPPVPTWHNPEYDRDEPNESDPDYLEAMQDADARRGMATMDALVMFGVELLEEIPEDDVWLKKLLSMQKHGLLDLSGYDLADEMDREFLYKRFVAVDNSVISKIGALSGVTSEGVRAQEQSFPGNA